MSQMKKYDKNMFASIQDGIYEIMDKYIMVAADNSLYGAKALDEVCFFLAENDIPHSYTVIPAPASAECDEIISLVWLEKGAACNEVWYSRGKTCGKVFRVNLTVHADSLDVVEDWVSTLGYDDVNIDIVDWSAEEV